MAYRCPYRSNAVATDAIPAGAVTALMVAPWLIQDEMAVWLRSCLGFESGEDPS